MNALFKRLVWATALTRAKILFILILEEEKSRDGGTGRRSRLKLVRAKAHEGSSPSRGT